MADIFDYLNWRGDIPFSQVPPTPVDGLIFSALVYIDFADIVQPDLNSPISLSKAAEAFLSMPETISRVRVKADLRLLEQAAQAPRFRDVKLSFYRNIYLPEEQTQFAAMVFSLDDGTDFLAFRGTDYSLVGWKEDFNMSFQDSVPAQREAERFTEDFAALATRPLHLGGHSKGGNLAVFAGARCAPHVQQRIRTIYNFDGPGFTEYMMGDAGYLRMVPKIQTYIPQSSIIGMLLEHEEPYTVIKSSQVGILQHELYSWDVMGGDFIHVEEVSAANKLADQTVKDWVANLSRQERSRLVDALYEILSSGGADTVDDLIQPKYIRAILKALNTNTDARKLLTGELIQFLRSAGETVKRLHGPQEKLPSP